MNNLKNILEFCLKNPDSVLCKIIQNPCFFNPELCKPPVMVDIDICKMCPVCCVDKIVHTEKIDEVRKELIEKIDILEKIGSFVENYLKEFNSNLASDETVIFIPIVVKKPNFVSEGEAIIKSGAIVPDREIRKKVYKALL